ncbi:putative proline-rich protein [Neospora caninum Liverpool]|uniref:Proline-rich protein, putative n=1 Tax=Neospora caninum (strain Liverpool) TaxID=572307 RepID=F0VCS4_NEOCL|nr:putative proline-rich protein [Neospora caninum Liverpool]CBZ51439.1 putative proline-rich protein [Neospora caninum Liverpool]CEL65387.1 TPA: proline-rich protein, putative [Neospora caninum Liverpool]|eukprot:XP_003881472.1 putative proline-rich protein [Neospora caninum Liverpool]
MEVRFRFAQLLWVAGLLGFWIHAISPHDSPAEAVAVVETRGPDGYPASGSVAHVSGAGSAKTSLKKKLVKRVHGALKRYAIPIRAICSIVAVLLVGYSVFRRARKHPREEVPPEEGSQPEELPETASTSKASSGSTSAAGATAVPVLQAYLLTGQDGDGLSTPSKSGSGTSAPLETSGEWTAVSGSSGNDSDAPQAGFHDPFWGHGETESTAGSSGTSVPPIGSEGTEKQPSHSTPGPLSPHAPAGFSMPATQGEDDPVTKKTGEPVTHPASGSSSGSPGSPTWMAPVLPSPIPRAQLLRETQGGDSGASKSGARRGEETHPASGSSSGPPGSPTWMAPVLPSPIPRAQLLRETQGGDSGASKSGARRGEETHPASGSSSGPPGSPTWMAPVPPPPNSRAQQLSATPRGDGGASGSRDTPRRQPGGRFDGSVPSPRAPPWVPPGVSGAKPRQRVGLITQAPGGGSRPRRGEPRDPGRGGKTKTPGLLRVPAGAGTVTPRGSGENRPEPAPPGRDAGARRGEKREHGSTDPAPTPYPKHPWLHRFLEQRPHRRSRAAAAPIPEESESTAEGKKEEESMIDNTKEDDSR